MELAAAAAAAAAVGVVVVAITWKREFASRPGAVVGILSKRGEGEAPCRPPSHTELASSEPIPVVVMSYPPNVLL